MKAGIGYTIPHLRKSAFTGMITEWTVTAGQTITLQGQSGAGATYLFDVNQVQGQHIYLMLIGEIVVQKQELQQVLKLIHIQMQELIQ
jgi:ABC-type uncharacterized transport system YnjBCD ATPase subunit